MRKKAEPADATSDSQIRDEWGSGWETAADPREIAETNRMIERKRVSLRRAGELVAEEFSKLDFVHKVVLFGSVSKPAFKELSPIRRLRQTGLKVWHESKDVDLAVWVSDLTRLDALRLARSRAVNRHLAEIGKKRWPGVPHHQVDVFLLEEGADRYQGNLCSYGTCPKGKPECNEPGCGAQPLLRIYEGFHFDPKAPFGEYVEVLFPRPTSNEADRSAGDARCVERGP